MKRRDEILYALRQQKKFWTHDLWHNERLLGRWAFFLVIGMLAAVSTVHFFFDETRMRLLTGLPLGGYYVWVYESVFRFGCDYSSILRRHGVLTKGQEYALMPLISLLPPVLMGMANGANVVEHIVGMSVITCAAYEICAFTCGLGSLVKYHYEADKIVTLMFGAMQAKTEIDVREKVYKYFDIDTTSEDDSSK